MGGYLDTLGFVYFWLLFVCLVGFFGQTIRDRNFLLGQPPAVYFCRKLPCLTPWSSWRKPERAELLFSYPHGFPITQVIPYPPNPCFSPITLYHKTFSPQLLALSAISPCTQISSGDLSKTFLTGRFPLLSILSIITVPQKKFCSTLLCPIANSLQSCG